MSKKKKFLQAIRDLIYRIRYYTFRDPLNKGCKWHLAFNYIRWFSFYKYFGRKYTITLQNGYKSLVYPYPDHDAGEANIFTRNVDYHDNEFIRKNLKPGDFIVDAGCNVGNRTWVLADIIGGALLIDPNPAALSRAKENLKLNRLDEKDYFFLEKGVGHRCETKLFSDLGGASTQNAIVENHSGTNTRSIQITTIDTELKRLGKIPVFIKIDVEGYDFNAIQGARNTLLSGEVRLVKFENNRKELIQEWDNFFHQINWQIFALDEQGRAVQNNSLVNTASNLFAAPTDQQLQF